jgi:hypothetical protein
LDAYRKLPEKYWPKAVCLHPNDVLTGLHKELRPLGLPLLTAGNGASPWFVDRFYDIVRNYEFSSSAGIGSQTFLCEEFGLRYFLLGDPPRSIPNLNHPKSQAEWQDEVKMQSQVAPRIAVFDEIFRQFPPQPTEDRIKLVADALGLEKIEATNRSFTKTALLIELSLTLPRLLKKIFFMVTKQKKGPELLSWFFAK